MACGARSVFYNFPRPETGSVQKNNKHIHGYGSQMLSSKPNEQTKLDLVLGDLQAYVRTPN